MQPAVPAEVREGGCLAGTHCRNGPWILTHHFIAGAKIFFFITTLVGLYACSFIQFDIELDAFNNFMNLSMGLSLNCENFQMFF